MPNEPHPRITHLHFRETIEHLHATGHLTPKQRAAVLLRTATPNPVAWADIARILTHTPPKTGRPCSIRTARTHYQRGINRVLEALTDGTHLDPHERRPRSVQGPPSPTGR